MEKIKSRIIESRKRCLDKLHIKSRPSILDNDEEQLLGVLYAPNRSGFPDVTFASQLKNARPEIAQYVQQLMYTGKPDGYPDVDAALDSVIPYRVQYGSEVEPFINIMTSHLVNLKKKTDEKND